MRLAKKFTFVHEGCAEHEYLYTAEQDEDGSFIVTWEWNGEEGRTADPITHYGAESVERNIVNGVWRVREIIIGPEKEEEKMEVLKLCAYGVDFELTKIAEGWGLWAEGGLGLIHTYSQEQVDEFLTDGAWQWQEPKTRVIAEAWPYSSLETGEESAQWFSPAQQELLNTPIEYLPPDDIDALAGFDEPVLSLRDVQQFSEDTGYTVQVDEDFISFVFDGHVEYVVQEPRDAVSVMGAIRVLTKFSDRG